ncbi:DUF317 domain-containing protein [Streptomyces sp. NPDC006285]|uniref:DUF317 domain-containing protein n=1 Tax=Streptomyces sp. NPDC006285 TaxID=3364742 RepID=UPI0036C4CF6C
MSSFAPTDRVLVSPRHLAGAGTDHLRDALGPLIHSFGWSYTHDAATGHIALNSPCHSAFLDFTPSVPHGPWWRISHHEPYWQAQFGRHTPIEAIAAFAQALPQFLGDTRHADRIPLATSTLVESARLNGWDMTTDAEATVFTSADGHCVLTHEPHADLRWQIRHCLADDADTAWTASATQATPARLVGQFFAHLASIAPVRRTVQDLPARVQSHPGVQITLVAGAPDEARPALARAAQTPMAHHSPTIRTRR